MSPKYVKCPEPGIESQNAAPAPTCGEIHRLGKNIKRKKCFKFSEAFR